MKNTVIRTLFLTRFPPYPPIGGAPIRNWQNINIMMKFGPVAVVSICFTNLNNDSKSPPGVAFWSAYSIEGIANHFSVCEKIKRRGWFLRPHGHQWCDGLYLETIAKELDKILTKFQPDMVIFEELWLYRYLPVVRSHSCRIIFDSHNVEASLRKEITHGGQDLKEKVLSKITLTQVKSIERNFIRQADQVWVCSDKDALLLRDLYGEKSSVHVIPNGIEVSYYDSVRLGACTPPREFKKVPWVLIFIAAFGYQPNVTAAHLLLDQIYPHVRKAYVDCLLLLVGPDPTRRMLEVHEQDPGVLVTGRVNDVRPYLAASSVVVVPLIQGGGTRLKILEAFAGGRPVVSTGKGAEGLSIRNGKHILISNNPEDIAERVCRLWADSSLRKSITHNAYELVKEKYSWESVSKREEQAIRELL